MIEFAPSLLASPLDGQHGPAEKSGFGAPYSFIIHIYFIGGFRFSFSQAGPDREQARGEREAQVERDVGDGDAEIVQAESAARGRVRQEISEAHQAVVEDDHCALVESFDPVQSHSVIRSIPLDKSDQK